MLAPGHRYLPFNYDKNEKDCEPADYLAVHCRFLRFIATISALHAENLLQAPTATTSTRSAGFAITVSMSLYAPGNLVQHALVLLALHAPRSARSRQRR
jgi:hypothetical protein